ncbi:MAG: hypothetical protein WD035_00220 [Balneolaceae bacterium]
METADTPRVLCLIVLDFISGRTHPAFDLTADAVGAALSLSRWRNDFPREERPGSLRVAGNVLDTEYFQNKK